MSRDSVIDAARRAKIAAAHKGKKQPARMAAILRKAHLGKRHSEAARAKMSDAHRKRGTRPSWIGEPWTKKEDALLRRYSAKEVANRTGRSLSAVYQRRYLLGLTNGRAEDRRKRRHEKSSRG